MSANPVGRPTGQISADEAATKFQRVGGTRVQNCLNNIEKLGDLAPLLSQFPAEVRQQIAKQIMDAVQSKLQVALSELLAAKRSRPQFEINF